MAIDWRPPTKRKRVERVLLKFPAEKSLCDKVAARVLAISRENGGQAWRLKLIPKETIGPFMRVVMLTKTSPTHTWYFHYCVETQAHCVDVLTGPGGTEKDRYLHDHFKDSDAIDVIAIDRMDD